MITLPGWLTILNLILLVGGGIVGFFTVRSAITKANQDTQTRVREALHDENELLAKKVERVEKDNKRLESLIQTLMVMLKKIYHIEIEIDGDIVYMRSPNGTHSSRIPTSGP